MVRYSVALYIGEALRTGGFDINRAPRRMQPFGDTAGVANEPRRRGVLANADQDAVPSSPRPCNRVRLHMCQQLIIDSLCRPPQGELTQSRQVSWLKIVANGAFRLMRHIDLALVQALDQLVRRDIDDLDVVGVVKDAVGYRFAHPDTCDPRDDVVEALDMLDVKGRIDIDTAGDQLFDIKVALWMTAAGCVRVCQFVDQHQLWPPLQDGVEIHLSEAMSLVIDLTPRNVLKPAEQSLGLAAPVRLDDADDHIEALAPL